ncbi:hypothetical protein BH23GEM9_BH23GEM9_21460 [soil metagenome]
MPGAWNEAETRTSAICRITEDRSRWRVLVETWDDQDICRGRLLFQPDLPAPLDAERHSAAVLEGSTHEDVLARAHDLTESELKRVLHSL